MKGLSQGLLGMETLMTQNKKNKLSCTIKQFLGGISLSTIYCLSANAAPVMTPSSLPLTGDDINLARQYMSDEEDIKTFARFIKGLDVYPDHQNPTQIPAMENKNIKKTYYISPYFQPPKNQQVTGTQEIAKQALEVIAAVSDLTSAFDYDLVKLGELDKDLNFYKKSLEKVIKALASEHDKFRISVLTGLKDELKKDIAAIQQQKRTITSAGIEGLQETGEGYRKQISNQVRFKLALLGIEATSEELNQFNSLKSEQMVDAITTMIARATNQGQFGIRQGIFTNGYTKQQAEYIKLYRLIRNDVKVSSVKATTVYARAASLTAETTHPSNHPVLNNGKVNALRLFTGVNAGTQGRCGNTKSCNVVIDLSYMGALMALTSQRGAITFPVIFEADVTFKQPDFHGTVNCDFKTGRKAQGRADVKDGGVIYDGDVYNKIHYSSSEEGACNYEILEGDANSAAYYTIKTIYNNYMRMKTERAMKSKQEKDRYQEFVNREIQHHATQSQQQNGWEWHSLTTWTRAFGSGWGTVVSYVVGSARNFYWHTRIENTSNYDNVKFSTTIKEKNVLKTARLTFDGNPLMCWKGDMLSKYLSACPTSDYGEKADHDVGTNQQLCGDQGTSAQCIDTAEDADENANTDDNGVIQNPWD